MNFFMIMWCVELPIILGMIAMYIYARIHQDSDKKQHEDKRRYENRF